MHHQQLHKFIIAATEQGTELKPCVANGPYGENKLSSIIKDMFTEVQTTGKANHSLRVTGTTALLSGNYPEKVILECTGHRSLKALRIYVRVNNGKATSGSVNNVDF